MGPNPNGPLSSKLLIRAIRYSGFFGVREKWVLISRTDPSCPFRDKPHIFGTASIMEPRRSTEERNAVAGGSRWSAKNATWEEDIYSGQISIIP